MSEVTPEALTEEAAADARIMRHIAYCGVVTVAVALLIAFTANSVA